MYGSFVEIACWVWSSFDHTKQNCSNKRMNIFWSRIYIQWIYVGSTNELELSAFWNAFLTETASPLSERLEQASQLSTKQPSNVTTITLLKLTSDSPKTPSQFGNHTPSFRHTKHRNSTKLSKHVWSLKSLKTTTLTILFHGISFHVAHPTTVQVKDVTFASKRNF